MAATYDTSATNSQFSGTSISTNITIANQPNRAAILCLYGNGNLYTGVTITLGGVTATAIPNAANDDQGSRMTLYQVINPPTGAQTATASYTNGTGTSMSLGVVSAYGVDQTTPCTNGGHASKTAVDLTTVALAITSANGDRTVTFAADGAADSTDTVSQSPSGLGKVLSDFACAAVGGGTGTTTDTWTPGSAAYLQVCGANFLAAGGASVAQQIAALDQAASGAVIGLVDA